MNRIIEGNLSANNIRFGIITSRFNEFITSKLRTGAIDCIVRHEGSLEKVDSVWVPGAYEIPLIAKKMAMSGNYDAIICLGAVIKGETPHFDCVVSEVSKGVATINLETGIPTIFGVLTVNNLEQAIERSGTKSGNKGWDAALAAMEMASVIKRLEL